MWLATKQGKKHAEKECKRRMGLMREDLEVQEEMTIIEQVKLTKEKAEWSKLQLKKGLFEKGANSGPERMYF